MVSKGFPNVITSGRQYNIVLPFVLDDKLALILGISETKLCVSNLSVESAVEAMLSIRSISKP